MNNNNDNFDISKAIVAGLEVLNDRNIRVSASLIEDLTVLKNILENVRVGKLVIATPDRILSTDAQLSTDSNEE